MGYAIGRNIGTAVVRNRIRRRLRAILATEIDLEPGLYLFGVHDASAADVAQATLVEDLARLVADSMLPERPR